MIIKNLTVDADVTAIKTETDKIPAEVTKTAAIKTETDKIPDIKTETDKIPDIKTETDKIPAEVIKTAAIKTETDKIPAEVIKTAAIKTETDKIPDIKTETDKIPAEVIKTAAIKTETDKIPAEIIKTAEIKAKTDNLPDVADGCKTTTIADGTTIPNNSQAAAGLLATASAGDILIEEIIWQRGATNFEGPTNYEFTTDNVAGLTGVDAPQGVALLVKFNAAKTSILSIDGATKQLPFVLESGKKLYIHGDDAATSAGGTTNFYIKYKRLAAGASLT